MEGLGSAVRCDFGRSVSSLLSCLLRGSACFARQCAAERLPACSEPLPPSACLGSFGAEVSAYSGTVHDVFPSSFANLLL